MATRIPCFTEVVTLSAEEAAEMRMASKIAEVSVEEDIWGKQGILITQDVDGLQLGIKPMATDCTYPSMDAPLIGCPRKAIQNLREEELLNMQRCFFHVSVTNPSIAEEVWLQDAVFPPETSTCRHVGLVCTTNAHAKRPFCHVRLFPAAECGNIECSTFRVYMRAADMVLGRPCSLEYEEQTDHRTGRLKLVATKVCFRQMEGVIMQRTMLGVFIRPIEDIKYGTESSAIPLIFAAFDRCIAAPEAKEIEIGSKVFYDLHGPLSAPEACDWRVDGGMHFKWNLPLPPKFTVPAPCPNCLQSNRWFPWHPQETSLVIASDPKKTRFRDDAFECRLNADIGAGFLRVHIVNMAGAVPKDSVQERWMQRILSRHHPSDAVNTRTMFGDWANTSAGIGFTVQEHRPALTMQLNMKLLENGWAVNGPAEFFESMVQLSVLVDAEQVCEEWVQRQENVSTPQGLILHPSPVCSELEQDVQQAFHDAQVVRDNRWRRLDENGRLEDNAEADSASEDEGMEEVNDGGDLAQIHHEFDYNSNTRNLSISVEELQPSHYYASRLLKVMNAEVFRVLEGYKELFGLVHGSALKEGAVEHPDERQRELIEILSGLNPSKRQVYEDTPTAQELEKFIWEDFGGSPDELYEALGWGRIGKKMAMAADVPDGFCCRFEFTKPGRLYTQLVSQRIFLDFVRNGMKTPEQMLYGVSELSALMERVNGRQQLTEKMLFDKEMAMLESAWPQMMQHGGLPTKAIVVESGVVFVRLIQTRVVCDSLSKVEPPVAAGTKVIIQLRKSAEGYKADLLAIRGRKSFAIPSQDTCAASACPAVVLRADAPAFVPQGIYFEENDWHPKENSSSL